MRKPKTDVTDAELAVLKTLWELGPAPIRRLCDRLYPDGEAAGYATVQKLLDRLEAKGCVRKRPSGRANLYTATVAVEDLIALRLRDTANRLCGGSLTPLLTHLVSASRLEPAELRALRELVARLDASGEK